MISGGRRFPFTDHVLFATPHSLNRKRVNLFQIKIQAILYKKENRYEQRNGESPLYKDRKFKFYHHP